MNGQTIDEHWAIEPDSFRERLAALAKDVHEARSKAKCPDIFMRKAPKLPAGAQGEVCFLRRWNSHTANVTGEWGGGYFVRWNRRGVVIDPGCSFIRAFSEHSRYSMADIDMVITTHDHVDHCQDLGTLISLLREFNKWRIQNEESPKTWDVVASHGVYDQYASLLRHPENELFLNLCKPLAPGPVERLWEVPEYLGANATSRIFNARQRANIKYHGNRSVADDYRFDLACSRTQHHELLGERTGLGLTFGLRTSRQKKEEDARCVVSFSSDTGINDSRFGVSAAELGQAWKESQLVVLHVGTTEKHGSTNGGVFKRLDEHLGFFGVCEIVEKLQELHSSPLRMVVLAEWGRECGGFKRRSEFCELVADALTNKIGKPYYSVTRPGARPANGVAIVPCDVALRVSLPKLGIWCPNEQDFLDPHTVIADEVGERIDYDKLP